MLHIDNQVITLVILILCVIICFKSNSTILCAIIGAIIMSMVQTKKTGESLINFNSLLKKIKTPLSNDIKNVEKKVRENFYINNDYIKILSEKEAEDRIETEMDIEISSNKIKDIALNKERENKEKNKENIPISKESINKELYITKDDVPTNCSTDSVIDGDESIAYNSIHRNEPTRVIIGMGKAYQNLSRYVLEEVQEIEGKEWWGNNEY